MCCYFAINGNDIILRGMEKDVIKEMRIVLKLAPKLDFFFFFSLSWKYSLCNLKV